MSKLILVTDGSGKEFYLNADKIVTVYPVEGSAVGINATIHHEPYNRENTLDWVNVKETPDRIAYRCEEKYDPFPEGSSR